MYHVWIPCIRTETKDFPKVQTGLQALEHIDNSIVRDGVNIIQARIVRVFFSPSLTVFG